MAYKTGCIHLGYIYLCLKSRENMLYKVKICLLNVANENDCLSDCPFLSVVLNF